MSGTSEYGTTLPDGQTGARGIGTAVRKMAIATDTLHSCSKLAVGELPKSDKPEPYRLQCRATTLVLSARF